MTVGAAEICRAARPDADEGWCSHILWGRTCYPIGKVTAQDLYRAASRQARAERNERVLCDLCDEIAAPGSGTCSKCEAALQQARESLSDPQPDTPCPWDGWKPARNFA